MELPHFAYDLRVSRPVPQSGHSGRPLGEAMVDLAVRETGERAAVISENRASEPWSTRVY
jgi:hypothetical protein